MKKIISSMLMIAVLSGSLFWYADKADVTPVAGVAAAGQPGFGIVARTIPNRPPDRRNTLSRAPALSAQIDALIASGKAEDAWEAYLRIASCAYIQKWHALPFRLLIAPAREPSPEEEKAEFALCTGLTERMKTSRLDYLETAAKAGVRGADLMFLEEGPFGDPSALASRPDDPLVRAWKRQAIAQVTAQANGGDMGTLFVMNLAYISGNEVVEKNSLLALSYGFALRQIYDQIGISRAPPSMVDDERLRWVGNGLTPDQIASAAAAGNDIAANFRASHPR